MAPTADSQAIAVIQTKVTGMEADLATISCVLLGNGDTKDSLVVRMSSLEQSVEGCQTRHTTARRSASAWGQWLVTSAIAVTALVVIIIKS